MSGPAQVDQTLWQGDDTPPLVWGFGPDGSSEIPVGARFQLEIGWLDPRPFAAASEAPASGAITVTSADTGAASTALVVDETAGTVTWSYTAEQSASLPRGAVARYQLRCLQGGPAGTRQTWAYGRLRARGVGLAA